MDYVTVYEKATIWVKHTIQVDNVISKEEAINKVIECYKQNGDPFNEKDMYVIDTIEQTETEEFMTVEENDGYATIEVMDGNDIIWDNGKIR